MSAAMMQDRATTAPPIRKAPRKLTAVATPRVTPRVVQPARGDGSPGSVRRLSDAPETALRELSQLLLAAAASGDGLAWLKAHAATFPLLDGEQETRLARLARGADPEAARAARERMTLCNLRLVVRMARRMFAIAGDLELCDLINDGVIGLMHATELFDPQAGYRFSTYATWWIAQALHRSIAQRGHAVRLPQYLYERKRHLLRLRTQLLEERLREPTLDELVAAYAERPVRNGVREAERSLSREDVALLLTLHQPVLSLATPAPSEHSGEHESAKQEMTLGGLVGDPHAAADFEAVEMSEDARWMLDVARYTLRDEPRMYAIWRARVLSESGDGLTLEEVGRQYGLTRERVRQIVEVANARVRAALVECGVTPPRALESYPTPYDERHKGTKRAWERAQRETAKAAAKAATPKPVGRPRKAKAAVR